MPARSATGESATATLRPVTNRLQKVGGGFLIADDLGPAHGDAVTGNVAWRSPGGCGVIVAGHTTAGVWGNLIESNVIAFNGLDRKSPGAGVVIATEIKHERVSGNVVIGNVIHGNGLSGVTIHAHEPRRSRPTRTGGTPPSWSAARPGCRC